VLASWCADSKRVRMELCLRAGALTAKIVRMQTVLASWCANCEIVRMGLCLRAIALKAKE
jgi:hypothetical protein